MNRQPGLSKSRILSHRQCPKRLWLQVYRPELAEEAGDRQAMLVVGNQVGEVARSLFPGGLLIDSDDLSRAQRETAAALAIRPRRTLFEATFSHQKVLVRADILHPAGNGYRMAEIKASSQVKPYHMEDAAIQSWVLRETGVRLHRVEIGHINREFIYPGGGDYRGLFSYKEVSKEVKALHQEVAGWVREARRTLARAESPETEPGSQCQEPFPCPFVGHCDPTPTVEPRVCDLAVLPRSPKMLETLQTEGFTSLRQVPPERLNNPRHRRMQQAIIAGRPVIEPEAGEFLRALPYPRYYLDFETMQFAVPVWTGTGPYRQIPFQWSCHVEKKPGGRLQHFGFLAEGHENPCRELVAALLETVGHQGSIFVYSPFEQQRLAEMAANLPSRMAMEVTKVIGRLVDLLPLTRNNYYHPEMRGSWSLKAVLPTIAPDLDYTSLAVSDGLMAQVAFQETMHPETTAPRKHELRKQLIEYCHQDTLALVRLVHFLMESKPCRQKSTMP